MFKDAENSHDILEFLTFSIDFSSLHRSFNNIRRNNSISLYFVCRYESLAILGDWKLFELCKTGNFQNVNYFVGPVHTSLINSVEITIRNMESEMECGLFKLNRFRIVWDFSAI